MVNQLSEALVLQTVRNYTADYDRIWIYDKIHHEINQYCSKHTLKEVFIDKFESIDEELIKALKTDIEQWAPGINIISVRVTKPIIPANIKFSFEKIESTKAKIATIEENGKLEIQKAKSEVERGIKDAKQKLDLGRIELEKQLVVMQHKLEMAEVENEIWAQKELSQLRIEYGEKLGAVEGIVGSLNEGILENVREFFFKGILNFFPYFSSIAELVHTQFDSI